MVEHWSSEPKVEGSSPSRHAFASFDDDLVPPFIVSIDNGHVSPLNHTFFVLATYATTTDKSTTRADEPCPVKSTSRSTKSS